jgi:hypothetical protein
MADRSKHESLLGSLKSLPCAHDPNSFGEHDQVRNPILKPFRISIDPYYPPPLNIKRHVLPDSNDNKFEPIFNEAVDAHELKHLPIASKSIANNNRRRLYDN